MNGYYGLVDNCLLFSTLKEFEAKKEDIKEKFDKLDYKEKVIYRMYVYSRPFVPEKMKELIWNIITGYEFMEEN